MNLSTPMWADDSAALRDAPFAFRRLAPGEVDDLFQALQEGVTAVGGPPDEVEDGLVGVRQAIADGHRVKLLACRSPHGGCVFILVSEDTPVDVLGADARETQESCARIAEDFGLDGIWHHPNFYPVWAARDALPLLVGYIHYLGRRDKPEDGDGSIAWTLFNDGIEDADDEPLH